MERMLMEYWANSIWQTPLLAAGAWLVLRVCRPGLRMRHGIWLGVLALAVVMPIWGVIASENGAVSVSVDATAMDDSSDLAWDGLVRPDAAQGWLGRLLHDRQMELSLPAADWLLGLYLATVSFALLRLLLSLAAARRMLKTARPALLSEAELGMLARCCERLRVRQPKVLTSKRIMGPVVVGAVRPVLLLPENFRDGSAGELEAVWWHELAHVRRRDYVANLVCRIVSLPVAYHPAVYVIDQRVRQTREMACDAMAAEQMESPVGYARCLVGLARRMQAGQGMEVQGVGLFDGGVLEERVMELIETKAAVSVRMKAVRLAGGMTAMLAVVAAAGMFHVTPAIAAPVASVAETVATAPRLTVPTATAAPVKVAASTQELTREQRVQMERRLEGVKQRANEMREEALLEPIQGAPPALDGPARVSAGVMAGNLLTHANPVYPAEAKAKHVSGTVVLHAIISKTGSIESLNLVSGPAELTASAWDAVKQWTYRPYLLNGEPTEVETTITVNYNLGGAPQPGNGPARVSSGVMAGNILTKVTPVYPAEAKADHISGAVVLHALISKTGSIESLNVISGPTALTASAIDAVKQWTYKPYLLNGVPTEVETTITVNYNLGEPAPQQ